MQSYPEPIVGAFIFNDKGELFLIKTHKWKDKYCVPGGHIEVGETIEQALIREAKEETGLDVSKPEYICLWEFINEKDFHVTRHMLFLNHKVKAVSNEVTLNDEAQDFIWVTPKNALKLPLEKYTRLTLENYLLE
jgi:nucleoside triphosphatase